MEKERRKSKKRNRENKEDEIRTYKEPKADVRSLLEVAPQREARKVKQNKTREAHC